MARMLRRATVLAVSGVSSPRFGVMSADEEEHQRDPMMCEPITSGGREEIVI